MSCAGWRERIALYVGGDLGDDDVREVELHLADCQQCREEAEQLRWTRSLLGELGEETPEESAVAAVRARVLERISEPRRWRWAAPIAAGLFLTLGLSGLYHLWLSEPPGSEPPQIVLAPIEVPSPPPPPVVKQLPVPPPPLSNTVQTASVKPMEAEVEPMVIKILTDDPNVVIYWLVGETGDAI